MIESGENFGKYTLLERLAVGGMAEIFKARVGGLDGFEKIVAIKRLHRQYSEDREFATMLIDEAKLAVQLGHGNIGQIFDLGCIDGQYFIVMEFIDGLDLHELAIRVRERQQVLPIEAVLYVACAVADALHYAHTKVGGDGRPLEIVHRDVSPQNIMLSVDGQVKLVDFGIAKARMRAQHTKAGIIKGKFYYMSPEQALGHRIDARTDVYALGMVLYETFAGEHPFEQIPDGELLKSVRIAKYPPISHYRPDLPRGLTEIVDRALARNPEQRYGSALELKRALEAFAQSSLPPFERTELARLASEYADWRGEDGQERRPAVEVMERAQYAASQHSVIFDVTATESDFEDEQTQVFFREGEEEPFLEDLEADGATSLLDWVDPAGVSATALPVAQEFPRAAEQTPEERMSDPATSVPTPAPVSAQRAMPTPTPMGPTGPVPPEPIYPQQDDARGVATQFDHFLRRKPHLVGGALAGVAVLLLAAAAVIAVGPGKGGVEEEQERWHASIGEEEQPVGVESVITLAVSTAPANAALFQDDRFVGNTPVTLRDLEVGTSHVLRFEKEDHDTRELNIVIEPDMAPLVVRLEPLGGIIQVETRPAGARIYVDGELKGEAPVTIMGLDRDLSYEIRAQQADGQVEEALVKWSAGAARLQDLRFEFEEEKPEAAEEVKEAPAPKKVAQRSRKSSSRRASAPARQRAPRQQPSQAPRRAEVALIPSEGSSTSSGSTALNVWELGSDTQTGRLNVRVNADSSRIYVDNQIVHDGATLVGHTLDVGSYEVKVYYTTLKRYSETQRVTIRAGETSTVTFRP